MLVAKLTNSGLKLMNEMWDDPQYRSEEISTVPDIREMGRDKFRFLCCLLRYKKPVGVTEIPEDLQRLIDDGLAVLTENVNFQNAIQPSEDFLDEPEIDEDGNVKRNKVNTSTEFRTSG